MMHRPLFYLFFALFFASLLASCGKGKEAVQDEVKGRYEVHGTLAVVDSLQPLTVIIDHHTSAEYDTVQVAADGGFAFAGETSSLDEIYLNLPSGEVARMFAEADGRYEVQIDSLDQITFAAGDTLNGWIQERDTLFAQSVGKKVRLETMDSLCRTFSSEVRMGLLLREHLLALDDSIAVRRCLGRLKPVAKPDWLLSNIDYLLSLKSRQPSTNRERLKPLPKLRCWQDSVVMYNMEESRNHSLLVYFWADYDSTSIDSLKMFAQLTKQYGLYEQFAKFERKKGRQPRRIELMSICLHAADSSTWKSTIEGVPGKHCLLEAGFSDLNVKAWRINRIPCTMMLDRFSTLLGTNLWGKELRQQLDRATINTDKVEEKTAAPAPAPTVTKPAVRTPKGARTGSTR